MNIILKEFFAGAFGYFKVTHDVRHLTKAAFLQPGAVTDVVVRFSTQVGELGSADTAPDAKGFAIKFYTPEGNYDFVGLNFPAFGNRDAMDITDLTHARMKNPVTHLQDYNVFYDIAAERQETMLFILMFFARTAFPTSYRFIDGFAIHTFKMVNDCNEETLVKLTFTSDAPNKSYFSILDALVTGGVYPEYLTKDLYDSIANKTYPTWTLNLQVMTEKQAKVYPYSPFDPTKYWNITEFPYIPVGKLTLNRNPTNYFNDVEQAAFCPGNLVPGIEPTPDRLLHARMFAYGDAQVYRLGVNNFQLPVNRCPFGVKNYMRDGHMNVGPNGGDGPNYFPNKFNGEATNNNKRYFNEQSFKVSGVVDRIDLKDEDNFTQCREYLGSLSSADVETLLGNMALSFADVYPQILQRFLKNSIDPISKEFGLKFRAALQKAAANANSQ